MITISPAFKTALALPYSTLCTIWKVTLKSTEVRGFTDHDVDVVYSGVTYKAVTGYKRSDVAGAADLSIDNMEITGILNSPAITDADLRAGIWDFADVWVALINWADTTMGVLVERAGKLGEVTVQRNQYVAAIRGITQAYAATIGELTQPGCRANLGDARCKVALGPFTVTSFLTGVSADGLTLFDTARTEAGPTGGVSITAISNANPGVVTLSAGGTFSNGEAVMLSGITGPGAMPSLNTSTLLNSLSGNTFHLSVDTTAYGAYSGGGTCTPLGSNSGYFDYGVITFTSGLNTGLSQEVRAYVPGQWTLELPFPYAIAAGDAYTMVAGCDKSLATCIARYSNAANFRGEPYLPGIDRLVQIGKQASAAP